MSRRKANHAVLGTREMRGWTVQWWQERALLQVISLQPQRTCGSGEADVQVGPSAFESVLVYGQPMIQDQCENNWSAPHLHHHGDDYLQCWLSGEVLGD